MNLEEFIEDMEKERKRFDPLFWWWPIYRFFYHGSRRLKYAWQRAYRGYDDTALWNLNDYITDIAIPCLTAMIENGYGYPMDLTPRQWASQLKKMRKGFEAYKWIMEDYTVKNKRSLHKKQREMKEGLELFAERFANLWD